jgi:hypothetical protein
MGVDYGLKKQCVRTPYPGKSNFWVDNVDCPGSAYPTSHNWITVAEIENAIIGGGTPCVGVANGQSVLINGPGSVVTQTWRGNSTMGYAVEFKVDYTNTANLCTPPTWSATGLIDNKSFTGATYPRPDQAVLQFDATYNRTLGSSAGATHVSAEMASDWRAAGYILPIHVEMQVELWHDPGVYCCIVPPGMPPDVLFYTKYTSAQNGITYYGILLDGSQLAPAIVTPLGSSLHITINWGSVIAHAIAENLVPPPVNGWASSAADTVDSVVGVEVRNNTAGPGGPMADLIISNYRESALVSTGAK